MVGFEHEDVRGADALQHQLGDMAEVRGKADGAGRGAEDEAHRVLRIVRNGKSFDAHIADLETRAGLEQPPVNFRFEQFRAVHAVERRFLFRIPFRLERPDGAVLGAAVAVNRDVKFIGQPEDARDVIRVLVGYQNGGKIFRRLADGGKALPDLQRREPGIHEDAGFGGLDIGAITGRTAAENGELDGHGYEVRGAGWNGQMFL